MRGSIASDRASATRCCWPPDSWPGVLGGLLLDADSIEQVHGFRLGFGLGALANPCLCQRDILEDREMREQIELLEHHSNLGADLLDVANVGCQLDAVDDDPAFLVNLETVDTTNPCGFART